MRQPLFWILTAILGTVLLAILLPVFDFDGRCTDCWCLRRHRHGYSERPAATSLKTITSAHADFRANDRDGDGVNRFWLADIAGLHARPPGGGPAIRLIEHSRAIPAARPRYEIGAEGERAPLQGYGFRAIPGAEETTIDAGSRFAAVGYPADDPKSGRWTFIVNGNNTIYRIDLGQGRGLDDFPTDDDLQAK